MTARPSSEPLPRIAHIAVPFSVSSSSIATVIRTLVHEHAQAGGWSAMVSSGNRDLRAEGAFNALVNYNDICPREYFTRRQVWQDHIAGLAGLRRPHYGRLQYPAVAAARELAPDVVCVHEGHYATASLPLWRELMPDTAIVLYLHTPISRAIRRRELSRLLQHCDGVISVSGATQQAVIRRVRTLAVPTAVVPNSVDSAIFHSQDRMSREAVRITYAGEVKQHKGVDLMFKAIHEAGLATAEVRVVGSRVREGELEPEPYEMMLRSLAQTLGIRVNFIPFVPRSVLADIFRDSDIVCVPSVWEEPFGMVAVEAMACGAAVIASSRGGLPEACDGAAVLVDPTDIAAFGSAISEVSKPAVLAQMSQESIARSARATASDSYLRFRDFVDSVVEERRTPK